MPIIGQPIMRFLNWIPFIGSGLASGLKWFFQHDYEKVVKTDLIVQVTPRIIGDGSSGIEPEQYHVITEKELIDYGKEKDGLIDRILQSRKADELEENDDLEEDKIDEEELSPDTNSVE